jgi:hypothetical protein
VEREQADPRLLDARDVPVEAAEQLVAAADGEEGGALLDGLAQRLRLRREVVRDERLLAVLAAADVEEVDLAGRDARAAGRRRRSAARARRRVSP